MQYQSLSQIGDILSQTNSNFWCKNTTGEYFGVGNAFVIYSSLSSQDEIVGETDYQLPWSDKAPLLELNDKEAQRKNYLSINVEHITNRKNEELKFLVAKFPVFNCKSQLLGTIGCAELITESTDIKNSTTAISATIIEQCQNLFTTLTQAPKYIHTDIQNKHSFIINGERIFFTERELHCLGLLVLGKSAKETGLLLKISAKTVEYHLQQVKDKLKCYHRSQLITLLFKSQVVPQLIQLVEANVSLQ